MGKPAIVVGHRQSSQGAVNQKSGMTEFMYNKVIAETIKSDHLDCDVVFRPDNHQGYRRLPDIINAVDPSVILSLHLNAFNTQARGAEALYYHRSEFGKALATVLSEQISVLLGNPNRGAKARDSEQRGGYLLAYTRATCVIAEPFFVDNDEELAVGIERQSELALLYANVLKDFLEPYE